MRYLVATKDTQGRRRSDFFWANEGEFVRYGSECGGESIDGRCGCRRSMIGMDSGKGTTTMKVVEIDDVIKDEATDKLKNVLIRHWGIPTAKAGERATEEANDIITMLEGIPVGVIMEKRGDKFQSRGRS